MAGVKGLCFYGEQQKSWLKFASYDSFGLFLRSFIPPGSEIRLNNNINDIVFGKTNRAQDVLTTKYNQVLNGTAVF